MTTSNINTIIKQIQNEITIAADGKGYASIRAVARLGGIDQTTLGEHLTQLRGEGKITSKLCKMLTEGGFKGEGISETGIPDGAIAIILQYYGFYAGQRCTEQARLCCGAFAAIGIRTWMQRITGWTPGTVVTAVAPVEAPKDELDAHRSALTLNKLALALDQVATLNNQVHELQVINLELKTKQNANWGHTNQLVQSTQDTAVDKTQLQRIKCEERAKGAILAYVLFSGMVTIEAIMMKFDFEKLRDLCVTTTRPLVKRLIEELAVENQHLKRMLDRKGEVIGIKHFKMNSEATSEEIIVKKAA